MTYPAGVHLVGSIPYKDEEEVWDKVFQSLPDRCSMVPDGETGARCNFVYWQKSLFPREAHSQVVFLDNDKASDFPADFQHMPGTGYDTAAVESYQTFKKMRSEGKIPSNVRFQVNIPGLFEAIFGCLKPEYRKDGFDIYAQRLCADVKRLQEQIPHEDLAIQIDISSGTGVIEWSQGAITNPVYQKFMTPFWIAPDAKDPLPEVKKFTVDAMVRLSRVVEPDVALGFHLCYGDINHSHFVQPKDLSVLVGLINDVAKELRSKDGRAIEWVHMPVPKDKKDPAYFAALKDLDVGQAKIFLGLIHPHDEAGTKERIEVARGALDRPWGVATECGVGRVAKEDLDSVWAISKAVSAPLS